MIYENLVTHKTKLDEPEPEEVYEDDDIDATQSSNQTQDPGVE